MLKLIVCMSVCDIVYGLEVIHSLADVGGRRTVDVVYSHY